MPYDESVIDFNRPLSLEAAATSSHSANDYPKFSNFEDSAITPDLLNGAFLQAAASCLEGTLHGKEVPTSPTFNELSLDKQVLERHASDDWNSLSLDGGLAESMDLTLMMPQSLLDNLEDSTPCTLPASDLPVLPFAAEQQISDQEIWPTIQQFFDTMHVIFPVLSYADLLSRIILPPDWTKASELRTLLLAMKMINAAGEYRMAVSSDEILRDLTRHVEQSRLSYDFAESPTLDEVIISLFLFTSYNVLEKHNRAFLYLDEALSLMESVQTVGVEEGRRKTQVEQVLYNTEKATLAIYAGQSKRRRARKPPLLLENPQAGLFRIETGQDSEKVALYLLERLTQIHVAEDTEALQIINTASEADMNSLFGAAFGMHRYCRIQAADVALTFQWQLSSKLVTSIKQRTSLQRLSQPAIDNLGTAALAWVCLLKEGEPRIVGLGKLAGLAKNIRTLSGGNSTSYPIAGLVSAVIREDHERKYAPELAEVISPMLSVTPRTLYPPTSPQTDRRRHGALHSQEEFQVASPLIMTYEHNGDDEADDFNWCIN